MHDAQRARPIDLSELADHLRAEGDSRDPRRAPGCAHGPASGRALQAQLRAPPRRADPRLAHPDTADVERRLREAEGRIRNVTEAMAKIGYSEALLKQLRSE